MTAPPSCKTLLLRRDGARLHVTLNRPETKNALSAEMVQELLAVVAYLEQSHDIGAVVLRGAGGTFCAGGDIKGFMAQFETPPPAPGAKDPIALQNRRFGAFLARFDRLPQTIVIVPAQIAPFVAARVGVPQARRLALTGERFDGREAWRIGLVHHLCEDSAALESVLLRVLGDIGRCAPGANAATKRLLLASRTTPLDALLDQAADAFAAARGGGKGRHYRLHREAAGVLGRQARDAALSGFGKILIANRGEIACRVMRTARALGYRTVAVYSEADRDMPHVAEADQAVPIGPAPAADSYLATDKIIAAARRTGADAVHPGYGFLSENAAFAAACAVADITFIGPPVEAIRTMGNKAAAKRRMIAAGVPCVPGHEGAEQSDKALAKAAAAIGLPVMVKAAAGGGGKGMRLVAEPALLAEALRAARSEAQKAFGSDELILEKAIVEPRHVEIQIFADSHGHVIHLGERDCSIQRRHQKVIEEGPSPVMTPALRQAMGAAAVTAAKAVDYVGAGTVEFLLAPDGRFHFLEMNTRLQVEHAVTEMVTGVDLVEWQIRVASGEALPLRQDDVAFTGHAIEARLYAEDAQGDCLPQAGRVLAWEPPSRPGVRVDHGIAAGVTVSPYYDPMLAKIIAHGATREAARRRLVAALMETVVLGVVTNRRFLIDCLSHSAFASADISTGFIARHFPPAVRAGAAPHPRLMALAAALIVGRGRGPSGGALSHWRSSGPAAVPLRLRCGDTETAIEVTGEGDGHFRIAWGGESCAVALLAQHGARLRFLADGLAEAAHVAWDGDALHLSVDGDTATFADVLLAPRSAAEGAAGAAALAPMPGTIAAVRVKPGDAVRKGQCLLVLEAMKMEHEIVASRDGTVAAVLVSPGEQVATRKLLVELAPQG